MTRKYRRLIKKRITNYYTIQAINAFLPFPLPAVPPNSNKISTLSWCHKLWLYGAFDLACKILDIIGVKYHLPKDIEIKITLTRICWYNLIFELHEVKEKMPVRKIQKNFLSVTGVFYSLKNKKGIAYESLLKRDYFLFLEFDNTVLSY